MGIALFPPTPAPPPSPDVLWPSMFARAVYAIVVQRGSSRDRASMPRSPGSSRPPLPAPSRARARSCSALTRPALSPARSCPGRSFPSGGRLLACSVGGDARSRRGGGGWNCARDDWPWRSRQAGAACLVSHPRAPCGERLGGRGWSRVETRTNLPLSPATATLQSAGAPHCSLPVRQRAFDGVSIAGLSATETFLRRHGVQTSGRNGGMSLNVPLHENTQRYRGFLRNTSFHMRPHGALDTSSQWTDRPHLRARTRLSPRDGETTSPGETRSTHPPPSRHARK